MDKEPILKDMTKQQLISTCLSQFKLTDRLNKEIAILRDYMDHNSPISADDLLYGEDGCDGCSL